MEEQKKEGTNKEKNSNRITLKGTLSSSRMKNISTRSSGNITVTTQRKNRTWTPRNQREAQIQNDPLLQGMGKWLSKGWQKGVKKESKKNLGREDSYTRMTNKGIEGSRIEEGFRMRKEQPLEDN